MAGDARKKGGVYSDNPKTMRTRDFLKKLPVGKKEEKRKTFLEYRSLRTTCITRSKKADYHQSHSRDDKLAMLREACSNALANRLKRGIEYMGTDIEVFIARFHDRAFLRGMRQKAGADASASDGADTPGPAGEADDSDSDSDNEQLVIAHNEGPSTAPASPLGMSDLVNFIDYHQGVTNEFDEYVEQLQEKQAMILQEMSVRSYVQFETANSLSLLLRTSGF
ncbi:hypothetical protein CI238_08070 [Colletotrichum incanum]|uniref:Uncharacterized protein n=1 Tax=Colletotrichum incanum TaxID=1573173 RepID=A0A162NJR6_COLIC|nr:hypothetical protein CI238_08070 [Colletotrichum incanum]